MTCRHKKLLQLPKSLNCVQIFCCIPFAYSMQKLQPLQSCFIRPSRVKIFYQHYKIIKISLKHIHRHIIMPLQIQSMSKHTSDDQYTYNYPVTFHSVTLTAEHALHISK